MNSDRVARWYRWLEYCAFGRALERRRFSYLGRLAAAERILILGEGDGRMLEKLRDIAPWATIEIVELSAGMIALARGRVGRSERIRFLRGDARRTKIPEDAYDGLVTCFFLDCFEEADARDLVERCARALKSGGIWLVSDFTIPLGGWQRWHAVAWIWVMYRFFWIATGLRTKQLPPIEKLLQSSGVRRVARDEERAGMMMSEVWIRPPDSERP